MAVRIQLRRGTAAEWTDANPTLAEGEVGVELDTLKLKVGDGETEWADLDYLPSGGGGGGGVSSVNGQTGIVVLDAADVGAADAGHTHAFGAITGAPTTLAGYGITDAQALDQDLTAIAALNTTGWAKRTGANTWALNTPTAADVGADPAGTAAAELASHVAASDPHGQYALESALGTAAALNVASSGNAASGEVVKGNDTRLSDARTPTTHTHTATDISDSTSAGRTVLTAANAAAQRTALGVPAGSGSSTGTNTGDQDLSSYATTAAVAAAYQPLDAELTAIAGLTSAADRVPYFTGSGAAAVATFTSAGRALVDDADAAAQRVTLGLATVASSLFWSTPANGTVVLSAKAAFAFTLAQIRGLKTSAGTLTLSVQINGANVTGLGGLSVTSTPQDVTATAANAVAVGDRVTVVIASASSAADLEFTLQATR